MSSVPSIAIVGGGFSGTMLAVQLAHRATRPLEITLYDASGAFARGVAYGTRNPLHLLNVPAVRMGAYPDRIEDFHRWLQAHGHKTAPEDFMPRMIYGRYLESLLQEAQRKIPIRTVRAEVTDATPETGGLTLTLADGTQHKVTRLALALGSLTPRSPHVKGTLAHPERYVGNVWAPPQGSILRRSYFNATDDPVLILGTGLTMIDMVLGLRSQGYKGAIIAVSRHGLLPQPHKADLDSYPPFLSPESSPRTALALLHAIRRETKEKEWRAVIDSLRADTPALWAALPVPERRRLARALSFWSTHRHRMPPQSATALGREMEAGTLRILAGNILEIGEDKEGLRVAVRHRGQDTLIHAGHVLNCMGASVDVRRSGSTLLASLLAQGLIEPGPLNWGVSADDAGRVGGSASRIFALGPLLTGERLETIAVPELRAQAEKSANGLLSSLAGSATTA